MHGDERPRLTSRVLMMSLGSVTHSSNAFDNSGTYAVYGIPSESNVVLAADLGFVDVEAANYRLKSTSPLIGREPAGLRARRRRRKFHTCLCDRREEGCRSGRPCGGGSSKRRFGDAGRD